MYVAEHDGNLHQFTLTSAFDVSTAGSQIVVDVSSFFGNEGTSPSRPSTNTGTTMWICGLHWNDDGTKLYINSLWGMTSTSAVVGSPNPSSVTGSDTGGSGTTSRTNTFAVIEFSVN